MKIEYVTGDLLGSDEKVILHGCNDRGAMGAGIALAIRKKWPEVFKAYSRVFETEGLDIGTLHTVPIGTDRLVVNAITQTLGGDRPMSYDAMDRIFNRLNYVYLTDENDGSGRPVRVAMPLIGAGLGGGHWPVIASIIEHRSRNYQPVVYLLPGQEIPK